MIAVPGPGATRLTRAPGQRPAIMALVCLCCLLSLGAVQPSAVSMLSALDNAETQLELAEAELVQASRHTGHLRGNAASSSDAAIGGTELDAVKSDMAAAIGLLQASLAAIGGLASPPPPAEPTAVPAPAGPERFLTFMWGAGERRRLLARNSATANTMGRLGCAGRSGNQLQSLNVRNPDRSAACFLLTPACLPGRFVECSVPGQGPWAHAVPAKPRPHQLPDRV
jgi:hypothetical protein